MYVFTCNFGKCILNLTHAKFDAIIAKSSKKINENNPKKIAHESHVIVSKKNCF